ncbi:peptidoglycan-binding domain-containing protein [Chlorogloeopsis sp. ULAP02]|uniref:peptidoglycan-binding domain-containing protein n=1 Tax=Chlorogloeopsis sp. ULAP02 TaxID=3107926 RepID=UPI003136023B
MSNIGLLMTGALTTGQPYLPNFSEKSPPQLDKDVKQSKQSHLIEIVPTTQITPPEFILADGITSVAPIAIAHNSTDGVRKKLHSQSFSNSVKKLKAVNKDTIGKSSRSRQQKYTVASDLPQQRFKNKPIREKTQVARLSSSTSKHLPTLHFGNTGNGVRALQKLLASHGYAIQVDGIFGALTETAVKAFQNRRNLAVDGIVGQRTWNQLTK